MSNQEAALKVALKRRTPGVRFSPSEKALLAQHDAAWLEKPADIKFLGESQARADRRKQLDHEYGEWLDALARGDPDAVAPPDFSRTTAMQIGLTVEANLPGDRWLGVSPSLKSFAYAAGIMKVAPIGDIDVKGLIEDMKGVAMRSKSGGYVFPDGSMIFLGGSDLRTRPPYSEMELLNLSPDYEAAIRADILRAEQP